MEHSIWKKQQVVELDRYITQIQSLSNRIGDIWGSPYELDDKVKKIVLCLDELPDPIGHMKHILSVWHKH